VKPFGGKWIQRHLNDHLVARPAILTQRCIRCGLCVQMCPTEPKAVNWLRGDQSRPPVHDYRVCIRCYCCQEICPEGAIVLQVPLLRKAFNWAAAGLTATQRLGRPNR
jgi:formate hydrogenlyase subunit 6/NADH:ubiquinone oxidoreductase subunit I